MPGCLPELQPLSCHLPRCSADLPKNWLKKLSREKRNQNKHPGDLAFRTVLVSRHGCLKLQEEKQKQPGSGRRESISPPAAAGGNTSHGQNTPWAQLTGINTSNIKAWNLQTVDNNICEAKTPTGSLKHLSNSDPPDKEETTAHLGRMSLPLE